MRATESHIAHFLHHLWATDGNISWKTAQEGRSPSPAIYYGTTSPILAEQVQHLLLRLGIQSSIRTTKKETIGLVSISDWAKNIK
ncbi:MAG: hypothetical protein IPH31_11825 [Lewinellaceae bacterium]|nr:hypothetical protein [Lewinellaceae bacterium]